MAGDKDGTARRAAAGPAGRSASAPGSADGAAGEHREPPPGGAPVAEPGVTGGTFGTIRGGTIRGALGTLRRRRRPLYGFALAVTAFATAAGGGIVALGFAAAWPLFEDARRSADASIAYEESYTPYTGQWDGLLLIGTGVLVLLLLLTALVLALLHAGHAVDGARVPGGREPSGAGELWRRTRPHVSAAFRTQLWTGLCVLGTALLGLVLMVLADSGGIPGVESSGLSDPATVQHLLVGQILPALCWVLALLLYFRLSVATAAAVREDVPPGAAVWHSWALTRRARRRTYGIGLLLTAAVVLAFLLLRYAAAPLAHPAGLAMLRLSGDNVWITGVLVLITPTAVALLLLPLVVLVPVCAAVARLYGELCGEIHGEIHGELDGERRGERRAEQRGEQREESGG